jgi:hypothetical protein
MGVVSSSETGYMKRVYSVLRLLYPEMDRFATQEEAILATRDAALKARFGSFRYFIKYQLAVLVFGPALMFFLFLVSWDIRLRIVFAAACILLAAIWEIAVARKPIRHSLRGHLIKIGVPVCLKCGYDLKGNVSGICPECGEGIGPGNPIDGACGH